MAGRHSNRGSRRGTGGYRWVAVVASVVAATAAGALIVTLRNHSGAADSAGSTSAASCSETARLDVAAAPSIYDPVKTIAEAWTATKPKVDGQCVEVVVDSAAPGSVAAQIGNSLQTPPDVWIPDSSFWTQTAESTLKNSADSGSLSLQNDGDIASSPIVVVGTPQIAKAMHDQSTNAGWGAVVGGKIKATIPDPTANTEGMLTLMTLNSLLNGSATAPSPTLVAEMVQVSHTTVADVSTAFKQLSSKSPALFTASEAAVIQANRGKSSPTAIAVYPDQGTMSLNYPYIRMTSDKNGGAQDDAAKLFEQQLKTQSAVAKFNAAGLRDAAGTPISGVGAAQGIVYSSKVKLMNPPTLAQSQVVLRMWSAASTDSRSLAVMDVSGSMNENAGDGQTRIQVASKAAADATAFFPDTSELGLWVFSTNQTATSNYAQLVPLGPLGAKYGPVTRRQALLAGAGSMPSRVHGDTALYDTLLAAHEAVKNTYDPAKENTVIVLTDGKDTSSQLTLPDLLTKLRAETDPSRPVPIIAIAVGSAADVNALQQISAVTGGKTYVVNNPTDIREVFIDAIVERTCRPNCGNK